MVRAITWAMGTLQLNEYVHYNTVKDIFGNDCRFILDCI